jgi:hypothetical protein
VVSALAQLDLSGAWLDGELIVSDPNGKSDFSLLQHTLEQGRLEELQYCVFDVLFLDGKDLRDRPVINYMPNFAMNVLSNVPARNHPTRLVSVHRVNTALSMLQVTEGAVVCPKMTAPLVRGFGLAFMPLRQPQLNWSVAMYVRGRPGTPLTTPSEVVTSLTDR